jgi:hypothetical protein
MKTSFPNEIAEYCIEGARAKVPNSVVQQPIPHTQGSETIPGTSIIWNEQLTIY